MFTFYNYDFLCILGLYLAILSLYHTILYSLYQSKSQNCDIDITFNFLINVKKIILWQKRQIICLILVGDIFLFFSFGKNKTKKQTQMCNFQSYYFQNGAMVTKLPLFLSVSVDLLTAQIKIDPVLNLK